MERLMDKEPPLKDRGQFLLELADGFAKGQVFLTALDLDIFSTLKVPKNLETIVDETGTDPEVTRSFLDLLVAMGVLVRNGEGYLTDPEVAPFLVKDEPYFARYLQHNVEEHGDWMKLTEALRDGVQGMSPEEHEHDYDRGSIDWIARTSQLGRLQTTIKLVSEIPEFNDARRLIDLGGGHGLFGIGFAQENPQLEVIIFDQPDVVEITEDYIKRYGMQDRVNTMIGDYTRDSIGLDYDVVFCALSFTSRSKEETISFYRKVREALNEQGLFIIQGFSLDDDRTGPLPVLLWDLKAHITGHFHFPLWTTTEVCRLFESAGFEVLNVIDMWKWATMPSRTFIARKRK
jgi:predicted O-methyltransferase YrrM